ncbi:hypothetical protein OG874_21545 [Nocardia sp. NBC_00565]|nr:hypothetical protein [Nocardia sp. NBC_00565]WUC07511.1 hypothetical protein OG874_21545 [Nocardia sp. NBC_00565]
MEVLHATTFPVEVTGPAGTGAVTVFADLVARTARPPRGRHRAISPTAT